MTKIYLAIGALIAAAATGVFVITSWDNEPASQAQNSPVSEAPAQDQYDYQTVWALFEESCRADEFMDNECTCMMDKVSTAHSVDATAYLALMGWDRFAEADVIAKRLGEDRIRAAVAFYQGKADGACARTQPPTTGTASNSASTSVRADAMADDAATTGQPAGGRSNGGVSPTEGNNGTTTGQTTNAPPDCTLTNATSLPGNLGTPIVRIKNGEIEALRLLSSGNRQRVAIARGTSPPPNLLLLDEPTIGLDLAEIAALEECVIYVGGRAKFGPGPQRGFTGKLTMAGSDISVTAGAEYIVWNEADGSTQRFPINQPFNLPANVSSQIVFLIFDFSPAIYFGQALVNIEPTNGGWLVNTYMRDMVLMMFLANGGNLNDYKSVLAKIRGFSFGQLLPLDEVVLVPPGRLELSWDASNPNSPTIKACFASQQVLLKALVDQGHDATTALGIIGRVIRGAGRADMNVCEALELSALYPEIFAETWQLNISADNGPGVYLIDLSD